MIIQLADVQKLRDEPSAEARINIAEKIASGFSGGGFGLNEKKVAVEIFRILVCDIENRVRKVLSTHLSQSMDAPRDVMLKLAHDVKEVALPVLQHSYILTEDDLIEITQKSDDVDIMSAIAVREMVSHELSSALLQKSNIAVTEKLLRNTNAVIDESGLYSIYDTCSDNSSILELMAKRGSIPPALAEKLFVVVSDEVKKILTKKYNISFQVADSSARYARELATLGLVGDDMQGMKEEEFVAHLHRNGRLTLSLLLRALCFGNIRFFEHAMAQMADIPYTNAQILTLDHKRGFISLYEKTAMPMELFPAVQYLLRLTLEETALGRFERNDFRHRLASKIARDSAATNINYMDYIMMIIQNNMVENGPY